jgi:hypothetical protein
MDVKAATPDVCVAVTVYVTRAPSVVELSTPGIAGPGRGTVEGGTQLPNCVIPVHIPFTSCACKKVPITGVLPSLNVTGTRTIIESPVVELDAAATSIVH